MRVTLALFCCLAMSTGAHAAGRNQDPNWPCEQIKVGGLSVETFWDGPAIDDGVGQWRDNAQVRGLTETLVQRRVTIERAQEQIAAFARGLGAGRARALTAVFADVFDALDTERRKVIGGLDRFGRRQQELAAALRQESETLRTAQTAAAQDSARLDDLTRQVMWDSRVFEARRQSIHYACDVPAVLEQRLYQLAKAIRSQISQ